MFKRYNDKQIFDNNIERYEELIQNKNLNSLRQYSLYNFGKLSEVSTSNYEYVTHLYDVGDRIENIAYRYYGDASLWWVICYTNKIANPMDLTVGKVLFIYFPIEQILGLLNG